jgi:hypothetical protein
MAKRFDEALKDLDEVADARPRQVSALRYRGLVAFGAGEEAAQPTCRHDAFYRFHSMTII